MIPHIKKHTDRLHKYCCIRYPTYGSWHEHPYHSHTHWFILLVFFIGWTMGLFFQLHLFPLRFVGAASYNWNQSSWSGGTTTDNANHTGNQAAVSPYPWTKYSAKDANLTAGATLTLTPITASATQTSDTDFNTGTHSSTAVSGSGASASVELTRGTASYFAVAHTTSPYITIYSQNGSTFTKLNNPDTLPTNIGNDAALSLDSTYLAVAHTTSPFITIYKRSGDTFTKLDDPATLPTGSGDGVAFSSDATYLAVAHTTSPFITIYKRSGDTFTKLDDPATLPPNDAMGATFSDDNTYLAVAHQDPQYITIYKRNGDTFTKLSLSNGLVGNTIGRDVAFSPGATHLAVAGDSSPYVTIFSRSSDTFTRLSNPATLPAGAGKGTAFSPDGTHLAVSHRTSPFVTIYSRSGDTFTKLTNPATLPPSTGWDVDFSPDGSYFAVAHSNSPFVTIYSRSGDTFTKLTNPSSLPAGTGSGASFTNPYALSGTFTSSVIDTAQTSTFTTLDFTATTPASTTLTVDVRAGNVATPDGTWIAWQTSIANGGSIAALNGNRYVQYRTNLSTTDTSVTSSLASISVNSSYYSASQTLTSSQFNTEASTAQVTQIAWVATTPASTTAKFQIRTAPDSSGSPGTWSDWLGPNSIDDYYSVTSPATVHSTNRSGNDDQWMQYRVYLTSTGLNSPTLSSATIAYSTFPATPSLSSATHPSQTTFYASATPLITITAGTPTPDHYHYLVNQTAIPLITDVDDGPQVAGSFTVPDPLGVNTITSAGTWYVHVVSQDSTDTNSANFATYTIKYDATAPTSTTLSFGSITASSITVSASASDATAGLHATPFSFDRDSGAATSGWIAGDWTDSGLSANTQYTYRVKSRDAVPNESSFTATQSKYTSANTPGTPSTSSPTTNTMKVTINENSNPSTTQYAIAVSTDAFASNTQYVQQGGALGGSATWQTYTNWGGASGVTVTGLTANTTYTFKVKAKNGDGLETSYSNTTSAYTAANSPTNFRAISIGSSSVVLSVDRFSGDTMGQAGYYFSRVSANSGWVTTSTWTDTAVSPNTTYTYSIKTRDSNAVESATSSAQITTVALAPDAPSTTATTATESSVRITPASSTNPATTQYAILETSQNKYVQDGGSLGTLPAWKTLANWGTVVVTGLSANTTYNFKMKARNSDEIETDFSGVIDASTLAIIGAPSFDNTATTRSSLRITLPTTPNPASITYTIQETGGGQYVQSGGALGVSAVWKTLTEWGTMTVTGLSADTAYTFRAKGKNSLESEMSFGQSASSTTLVAGVPRAPILPSNGRTGTTIAVEVDNTDLTANLMYAIFETTQGKYVQLDGSLGSVPAWQTYTQWGSTTGTVVTGLAVTTAYTFKVKLRDPSAGNVETAFGPTATASTIGGRSADVTPPTLPTDIRVQVLSDKKVRITWSDPSDADFSRVFVYRSDSSAPPRAYQAVSKGAGVFLDTEAQVGNTYQYLLRFEDVSYNGIISDLLRVVVPASTTIVESLSRNTEQVIIVPEEKKTTPPVQKKIEVQSPRTETESDLNLKELIRVQYPTPIIAGSDTSECTSGQLVCSLSRLFAIERVPGLNFVVDGLTAKKDRQDAFRMKHQTISGSLPTNRVTILGRFGLLYEVVPSGTTSGTTLAQPVAITLKYSPRDAGLILRPEHALALAYLNATTNEWELLSSATHNATEGTFTARVTKAGTYGIVITKSSSSP